MAGAFLYLCCCCSIHFKWVCKVLWNVFFTIMLVGSICVISMQENFAGVVWILAGWWMVWLTFHEEAERARG